MKTPTSKQLQDWTREWQLIKQLQHLESDSGNPNTISDEETEQIERKDGAVALLRMKHTGQLAIELGGALNEMDVVPPWQEEKKAIDNANERTKLLGASVSSVNAQLKAGEKQAGSFLRSLSPKTPADEIIKVVDGIITEVNTLNEQMKLAFTDEDINFRVEEIGKSLSATGAQMAKLMGNDFQEDLKRVRVAEKAINDAKVEGVEVTQAQKDELEDALVVLGGHEQSYKDTSDILKTIQRQTIERKGELENINKILKWIILA